MDWTLAIELGFAAAGAAILGSMLGLGGGVFLVPLFTLFFDIDPKIAVGASAVSVVANSIVGSTNHLRNGFTNLRISMLLGIVSALGALIGASIAVGANTSLLNFVFGLVLIYASASMILKRTNVIPNAPPNAPDPFELRASYRDGTSRRVVEYVPQRVRSGLVISSGAGVLSGLLGVGGGVVQVPAMNIFMSIPLKAAAGTSSFMVGITSVATATVFYADGKIDPSVVVPTLFGIYVGSQIGSRLTKRVDTQRLLLIFVVVLGYLGLSMLLKSFGINLTGR
ncbi:MAG: sulfite exporter TauE/SafE family protein [Thermomicrobiales bacterium]